MEQLAFWDCHAAIGRWTLPPPAGALDPDGLCDELQAAGIAGALVHHGLGRDYDPPAGNDVLLRELEERDHDPGAVALVPCVTLLPTDTEEFPPPEEHLPALIRRGVRGVRLYPKSHNFSLEEWCAGELLSALERHRLPVSIDLAETSWSAIHDVCAAHPALPVIVTRVNYRNERFLYPLFRRHPQLRVEISYFQGHRGVEEVVERFGPERLLFGTGLPFYTAGAPVVMVVRADVGDEARRAIAGENLRRLMEAVRP
jgi:hypothetical protein